MDLVRDFEATFNSIKDNPVKDVASLVEVVKKHSDNNSDPSSWRWDVMRSVVSADIDYVKLISIAELEHVFAQQKKDLLEVPFILNVTVMFLHTTYSNFKNLVDVVSIQQRVFGPELFAKVEKQMEKFLDKHCTTIISENPFEQMSNIDFAKYIYKTYAEDYKDYYFWPQMQGPMEKVMFSL